VYAVIIELGPAFTKFKNYIKLLAQLKAHNSTSAEYSNARGLS
jgi:hypothetical protein